MARESAEGRSGGEHFNAYMRANKGFAHYVLGMIYERQSKKDAARAEYQSALTFNPKHTDAKKALDALK